jgi:hypothetical protein
LHYLAHQMGARLGVVLPCLAQKFGEAPGVFLFEGRAGRRTLEDTDPGCDALPFDLSRIRDPCLVLSQFPKARFRIEELQ